MSAVVETLSVDDISRARAAARSSRRRVVDVLEETLALEPDSFTARLAATLSLERLDMGAELLHPMLRARLAAASRAISEGRNVSQSMDANGLTTPVALRMLAVGEKGGNMGEMLEQIAAFHDEELARWVDWFTRLFEPVLMALIGLAIGAIVVLMYMPIFELAGNLR